jgi:hypothetical protein
MNLIILFTTENPKSKFQINFKTQMTKTEPTFEICNLDFDFLYNVFALFVISDNLSVFHRNHPAAERVYHSFIMRG